MSEQIVQVNGIRYFTLLEGHTDTAPLVLLCHALMSNLRMWDDTVKTLNAAGYATLRFDHIGHDRTPPPEDQENASFHMDDIAKHMHHIVEKVTGRKHIKALIGCSIGGVLALRYAMLFPKDVDKVISIAAPGIATPEKAKALWPERIEQFERDVQAGESTLCEATVQRWFPGTRAVDERARARALEQVKTCSLPGYRALAQAITTYDYSEEVGGIQGVGCLVVAGSMDGAIDPEGLKELTGKIQGAEFVLMEGAGHLPPLHLVEEFDALMMRFLGS